ncbi:hypothetical protein BJV77DRAFT_1062733 [Russula vinacea]|nr:hypothetical protein BJV77DRAFT_1062733 [Russula vinacea]
MANLFVQSRSSFSCPSCSLVCKSSHGLTQHQQTVHRQFTPASDDDDTTPCDRNGNYLPPFSPPPLREDIPPPDSWMPFKSRADFDFSYYHFVEVQSSVSDIDKALDIWAASVMKFGGDATWKNAAQLYETIDTIQHGDSPWKSYHIQYQGPRPAGIPPKWMTETYLLCARDSRQVLQHQLASTQFDGKINFVPYRQFDGMKQRVWSNLMSADWAWSQADTIAEEISNHGAMFVPVVAGSDKTTVSVATGHQEYHPVYMSLGNLTNIVRRSHGSAVLPVAFLPIPKVSKKYRKSANYQTFCRQMYHACLAQVFDPLKDGMSTPEVVKCPDGHFRRAVYGLGPYIADYPEQVWLSGIVQGWCPKCKAHPENLDAPGADRRTEAITNYIINAWDPVILWTDFGPFTHEFPPIKGTFKDHLVTWVNEYLYEAHGETGANAIIGDIDRRISAVPIFPGLRRFPDGRDFAQWTGDDSKALMKVYLAAIVGYVPSEMVKTLSAFLDFCYIARRNALTVGALGELKTALARFHFHRDVFVGTAGVSGERIPSRDSTPSCTITVLSNFLAHQTDFVRQSPNPSTLSSQGAMETFKPLQCPQTDVGDDFAIREAYYDPPSFSRVGMMEGTTSSYTAMILRGELPQPMASNDNNDNDDDMGPVHGPRTLSSVELSRMLVCSFLSVTFSEHCLRGLLLERGYPCRVEDLAVYIDQPRFPNLLRRFLYEQLNDVPSTDVDIDDCPYFGGRIKVYHSAIARGMYRERIRSNPNWHGQYARRDTIYYPCALVNWLVPGKEPDEDTGLWMVQPEYEGNGRRRTLSIIHLDCVARAAHLLPVYGSTSIPEDFHFSDALDAFRAIFHGFI